MEKKIVTVIIPTYGRPRYIERAIKSVLAQTYKNIELIVVDDNNEDSVDRIETEKIIKKYEKKLTYIKHKINLNGSSARNTGIKAAHGEYITFLDDDDVFFPARISILVNKMENSNASAAYTSSVVIKDKKIYKINEANKDGNMQYDILKLNSFFGTGSNLFFRASALREINGFDIEFLRYQDLEIMVRFFEKYEIVAVKDVLVIKDIDDRKNMAKLDRIFNMRVLFLNKYKKIISKYEDNEKKEIYKTCYLNLLIQAIKYKDNNAKVKIEQFKDKYNVSLNIKDCIIIFLARVNSIFHIKKIIDYINYKKEKEILNQETKEFLNMYLKKKM